MKAGKGKKGSMKGHFGAVISSDSQRFSHPSQNYKRLNQCGPYATPLSASIPPPKMRALRAYFQGLQFLCYITRQLLHLKKAEGFGLAKRNIKLR